MTTLISAQRTGELGTHVTPQDIAALMRKPLRAYAQGELVAVVATDGGDETRGGDGNDRVGGGGLGEDDGLDGGDTQRDGGAHPHPRTAAGAAAAARASTLPAGAAQEVVLRYGRVVRDCRPPPGAPLYRVPVEVGPGRVQEVLSSNVYCFRSTWAASGGGEGVQQGMSVNQRHHGDHGDGMRGDSAAVASTAQPPATSQDKDGDHAQQQQHGVEDGSGASRPVHAAEVVGAVGEMLAAAGLKLDTDTGEMMQQVVSLQQQLADTQRHLNAAQEVCMQGGISDMCQGVLGCTPCMPC